MGEVKVSVIIPIYNVKNYLRACLDSVINQTLSEIEIICVDDGSSDGSSDILEEYANKDSRIIRISHKENKGTSKTRKDGVAASKGKYIMFLDGDDFLTNDACEKAFNAIEENKTDILQFGGNIVNRAGVPEERIEMNRRIFKPCTEFFENADILKLVWEEAKFRFNLCNKLFNGDLCRKAFLQIEDGRFLVAEDLYAFFVIAYYVRSSSGIEDELYNYNFGIGIVGENYLSIDAFISLLTEHDIYEAISRFVSKERKEDVYEQVLAKIYNGFLNECVNKWVNNITSDNTEVGFNLLIKAFGREDVICKLAENFRYQKTKVGEKFTHIHSIAYCAQKHNKKRLNIAVHYRNIKNGGAQRVVANLCNIWSEMKNEDGSPLYNIILITDTEKLDDEYPVNANITREFLPGYEEHQGKEYRERYIALNNIITKYDIDIVVNSMWTSPVEFWDMLCVKCHENSPAYIIHAHSFCGVPFSYAGEKTTELMYTYQICDGAVTLSECDRAYVSTFCRNTKCIVNPVELHPVYKDKKSENNLLWLGRFSKEKNPLDVIYMMSYIVKEIPDAKLYMVGDGDDEILSEAYKLVEQLGLKDNIIFTGFILNVEDYYKKVSVFIMTSEYEGFPLTLGEAMDAKLPIVAYDLPYLTYMRDGRGIVAVEPHRTDLLAKEAIKLLKDGELRDELGKSGRKQYEEICSVDIGQEWKELFDNIGKDDSSKILTETDEILYKYLTVFHGKAIDTMKSDQAKIKKDLQKARTDKSEINKKLQETYAEKSDINKKLQQAYADKTEINNKLQQTYAEKTEINNKLQQTYAEKTEINKKLQQTYAEKSEINNKLQKSYADKTEINNKLKQTQAEKLEINKKLQQTYAEKSEINEKFQQTYAEKTEINKKLQQTYAEKTEINKKLQQTYAEKTELNKKLQQTYKEKTDRGIEIKNLTAELETNRIENLKLDTKLQEVSDLSIEYKTKLKNNKEKLKYTKAKLKNKNAKLKEKQEELDLVVEEKEEILNSATYKVGKVIMWLPYKIKNLFTKKK